MHPAVASAEQLQLTMAACSAAAGPVIWENPDYVSPNDLRAAEKKQVDISFGHIIL